MSGIQQWLMASYPVIVWWFTPTVSTLIWYKLLSDSLDYSWNSNNWTSTSVTFSWTDASFNGSTSKILSTSALTLNTAQTFSCWFKTISASTGSAFIWSWTTPPNPDCEYMMSVNPTSNNWSVRWYISWTSSGSSNEYSSWLNDWSWHLFTYTNDNTNQKTYVDWSLVWTTTVTLWNVNTTRKVWIWCVNYDDSSQANFYNWYIKHVIIENRTWSATEITTYFNNP